MGTVVAIAVRPAVPVETPALSTQEKNMMKKLVYALAALAATISVAFAAVEVNRADQAALDGIKGIGPSMSKSILAERKNGGDFKDWTDFQSRVKGVGDKNSSQFSKAGLTVNGLPKSGAKREMKDGKAAAGTAIGSDKAHGMR
jgi:competence protein ComEA